MNRLICSAIALLLLGGGGQAQDVAAGQALFAEHCATCHGLSGTGDGPMTSILTLAPPDLTALAAAEGGTFPTERVVRVIDGRTLLSHGGPMPLFGLLLQGDSAALDAADGTPVMTSQPIVNIAAYLISIQK